MRKFHFPLDRVLEWRRTEARIEESKLERLHAEMRAIEKRESMLALERSRSEKALTEGTPIDGSEFGRIESFRRYLSFEGVRVARLRAGCRNRIADQTKKVAVKRLEIRLLERLREKKVIQWEADFSREIDQQAADSFIARCRPGDL